jgi:hypothetical protein
VEILQLPTLRSTYHSRPLRTLVNCQHNYSAIFSRPPLQSSTELSHSPSNIFTSLHLTSPHFTSLHLTSPHFTSLHLTSPHFTSLHLLDCHNCLPYNSSALSSSKTLFFYCCVHIRFHGNVFTKPLLRNGIYLFAYCIATAVLVVCFEVFA